MKTFEYNLKNHRYDLFKILIDTTNVYNICDTNDKLEYNKMIQRGDLDFHDYNTGFFNFEIWACPDTESKSGEWIVRIWIATWDDGDMGAWSKPMKEDKSRDIVHRIAKEVLPEMIKFPTLNDLNDILLPYGLYVCNE